MEGFFSRQELTVVKRPQSLHPLCGKCGLLKGCETPKMKVGGEGKRKILVLGEAPGASEDRAGVQFVGEAGQELQRVMRQTGIELHRDCWTFNALSCRPPSNKIDNPAKIDYCRPLVLKAIQSLKPRVIILTGYYAMKSVLGHIWKDNIGQAAGRWTGTRIPCRQWNCWICPTWHPSWILRLNHDVLADREFREHLTWAAKQTKRPWPDGPPDYHEQIKCIMSPMEAARAIEKFNKYNAITFDYETTTLKPTFPKAEIVCCSVSNGEKSIAFPWHRETKAAMKVLLKNPDLKKDGWNIKFEDQWTREKLGIRIAGWRWDGMIGAHIVDVRSGITGLEYQEFVELGITDHKENMKEFLSSTEKVSTKPNRIKEVAMSDLLVYNALDSLIEFELCQRQMKRLRII